MANFFTSSIGKKLIMSISGFFLMVFLLVHLAANLASLFGEEAYNAICHFMDTSVFIQIMVPVLASGFIIHMLFGLYLTLANRLARGAQHYAVGNKGRASSWASRNMFVIGLIILGFLGLHLTHFWAKMQLQHFMGQEGENAYLLVTTLFGNPLYAVLYIGWIWVLWLHLSHGFWSAFQTIGVNNSKWLPRLQFLAKIYATVIAVGFTIIPLWFLIQRLQAA
ncbi:MAG: succinate dehydrogenase cytochrome b subunit [Prevotellaceae bacterium]|jgi:succinate dehydrogenase / fumarate reductase cytochrome b subunit|nr:succinate dehydrogenase cytochrome b subunit [Prevotellaceae bacterium]